jgi:pentatricopeptide repeat protein
MQQQYHAGDNSLRPNEIVYRTVIHAFVKAGQANRAQELHDKMQKWK